MRANESHLLQLHSPAIPNLRPQNILKYDIVVELYSIMIYAHSMFWAGEFLALHNQLYGTSTQHHFKHEYHYPVDCIKANKVP